MNKKEKGMNKTQFIDYVAATRDISKVEAGAIVNGFIESVESVLAKGNEINITGFGSFYASKVAERTGHNPKTKEAITIAAYTQPKFKAGKSLKDACNGK